MILPILGVQLVASKVRAKDTATRLRASRAELQQELGDKIQKLSRTLADVRGQLSELTDKVTALHARTVEDQLKQSWRVKIEITRFFSGDPAAGRPAYIFVSIHNTSSDPIYDCVVDVLSSQGQAGTQRAGLVYGRQKRKLRFRLDKSLTSADDLEFVLTFFDYGQRSWRLNPGGPPVQLVEAENPEWVYREPQTPTEHE